MCFDWFEFTIHAFANQRTKNTLQTYTYKVLTSVSSQQHCNELDILF